MIVERLFNLELTNDGMPVWDIDVPTMSDGSPAKYRAVRVTAKKGAIVASEQLMTLVIGVLFAFDPRMPPQTRRIGLLTPDGEISDGLEPGAEHLTSFFHPRGFSVSVYDFTKCPTSDVEATDPQLIAAPKAFDAEALKNATITPKQFDISDHKEGVS